MCKRRFWARTFATRIISPRNPNRKCRGKRCQFSCSFLQADVDVLDYGVHLVNPEVDIVADLLVDVLVALLALDVLSFDYKVDVMDVTDLLLVFVVDVVVHIDVVANLQDVLDEFPCFVVF